MSNIEKFESMLAAGRDSALLRYSLGTAYASRGDHGQAAVHLRHAVGQDPGYSAAWKLLGRVMTELGDTAGAIDAYERGIEAAAGRGDRQAEKEMQVFLRRLRKSVDPQA